RQEAVKETAAGTDLFLIVGAPNSSNSMRLVEVARRAGAKQAMLVQRASEIPWDMMIGGEVVGLSAGASAPQIIVDEIVDAFNQRFAVSVDLAVTAVEDENFPVLSVLRDMPLTADDMAFVNGNAA
ncbi:MAG TPA: 4-hydroxy-3-methylbut-2-enyl diphosphate reductase, partial [Tianweitania sediminis]|nr:4-hydroxy-3-methylbut-2-enyl diphosphate reductase [Tianweitania sediminis]